MAVQKTGRERKNRGNGLEFDRQVGKRVAYSLLRHALLRNVEIHGMASALEVEESEFGADTNKRGHIDEQTTFRLL